MPTAEFSERMETLIDEIHLGYPPIRGYTVLGDAKAEVTAGYAMPIPPNTRHGYTNIGNETHHVPFVYGSLTYGGWGVFLDVEPQPRELNDLTSTTLMSNQLNGTVQLDREIAKASGKPSSIRYPIIPAKRTDRGGVGGLELSVARITKQGLDLRPAHFCAVSVVQGRGVLSLAGEQIEIAAHDHFGIPAGLVATITETGSEPLVLLDAVLRRAD
jgi:mannose-6-phosphate isomerase-like protein (cupin superfamily)